MACPVVLNMIGATNPLYQNKTRTVSCFVLTPLLRDLHVALAFGSTSLLVF